MNPHSEVIWVLKLGMNIAPVALYFIVLGLVNSQSRVHVISSRRDWLGLMAVFFPVLLWPVMWLAGDGWVFTAVALLFFGVALLVISAPDKRSGWVIYNCNLWRVSAELLASLDHLGINYAVSSEVITVADQGVELELSEFRLLKNVTVKITGGRKWFANALGRELAGRLGDVESEPSMSAAAMLVSGSAMLILPLAIMVRHIDAFVKVFSDFIPV